MKKEELWKIYTDKNPQFLEEDAVFTMTSRGVKKMFDQTFDMAHDQGFRNGKARAELDAKAAKKLNPSGFPWPFNK